MSLDPLAGSMPDASPYCYAANNPVVLVDVDGLAPGGGKEKDHPSATNPAGNRGEDQSLEVDPAAGNATNFGNSGTPVQTAELNPTNGLSTGYTIPATDHFPGEWSPGYLFGGHNGASKGDNIDTKVAVSSFAVGRVHPIVGATLLLFTAILLITKSPPRLGLPTRVDFELPRVATDVQPQTQSKPKPDPPYTPYPPLAPPRYKEPESPLKYVTYTKTNPTTGQVYSGRTSGYGKVSQILANRDLQHNRSTNNGFEPPRLVGFGPATYDKDIKATKMWVLRMLDPSYWAIRGREQQLIDYYGGAQSESGGQSANKIRGVAKDNPMTTTYDLASTLVFKSRLQKRKKVNGTWQNVQ